MTVVRTFVATWTFACLAVAGCGGNSGPSLSVVSGTVSYQGKTLVCGTVQFAGADGNLYSAHIETDGTYRCELPNGLAKVGVFSPKPEVSPTGLGERRPANSTASPKPKVEPRLWVRIPDSVANPDESGLSVTVSGTTTYDIVIP